MHYRRKEVNTWFHLGYFRDEDAARLAARHWKVAIGRDLDPNIVVQQCRAMAKTGSPDLDPNPAPAPSKKRDRVVAAAAVTGVDGRGAAGRFRLGDSDGSGRGAASAVKGVDGRDAAGRFRLGDSDGSGRGAASALLATVVGGASGRKSIGPSLPATATDTDTSMNEEGAITILKWINESKPGGILGDNMGCGKTHTFILAACLGKTSNIFGVHCPILVVAPSKMVGMWGCEFQRWKPGVYP